MEDCKRNTLPNEISYLRPPRTTACIVCLDDLSAGGKLLRLPCSHCFHSRCIKPWLSCNGTCPICRRVVAKRAEPWLLHVSGYDPHMRWLWVYQLMELIEALFFKDE
ncbi:hypothetical protein R6Q59_027967 [Mikania micrantha]